MKFTAYNPYIKRLRSDGGFRLEFDVSETEYDMIKDLVKQQGVPLEIEINAGQTESIQS
jgi:hypothetical protein